MNTISAMKSDSSREEQAKRILVVDDEPGVCQSVEKVLRRKAHDVAQALSVADALQMLEAGEKFDLVIADLMMPQVDGVQLLKIVKDRWPQLPVLIMTGYASIASAVETAKNGAVGYIPKPFTPEELESVVEGLLSDILAAAEATEELPPSQQIDVDMPFDALEVAQATSAAFVDHLTRSDIPVVEHKAAQAAPDYCSLGQRNCKRMAKQGMCKQPECPLIVAERKKAARLGIVVSMVPDPIDVDMPFSRTEVASVTSEAYVAALGRSDMPIVGYWRPELNQEAMPRVLVVDDEAVVVNSIRKTLNRKAYHIGEAFSGREALERITQESFDLVLLDMRLPDADGLDLLLEIKRLNPQQRVVIVTGYASIDSAIEAIRRGADDYMAKPFTPDELYAVTSKMLESAAA